MDHRCSGLGFTEFPGSYIEGITHFKIEIKITKSAQNFSLKIFLQIGKKCGILIKEDNKKLKVVF